MKKAILFLSILTMMISGTSAFAGKSSKSSKSKNVINSTVTQNAITVASGPGITITADIDENVGVINIVLYYRAVGANKYNSDTMHADKNGEYRYIISQAETGSSKIEYYIEAIDFAGNTLLRGHKNSPLVANIIGDSSKTMTVQNASHQSGRNKEPLWKNKWVWIGVGVLATAALLNNSDDGGEPAEPGFSLTIEGSEPAPAP